MIVGGGQTRLWQWLLAAGLALAGLASVSLLWLATLEMGPDGNAVPYSVEVTARDGRLLRAFQTDDDRWRLPGRAADVDPLYLAMLKAYEDKRFGRHQGVDPLAMLRAGAQWLRHGRVISGGSTLAMQVARLLSPRENGRSLERKLIEAGRAIRLQRALGPERLLDLYLSLAPFGGNIEGVREASLIYFGKEPKRLSAGEAALLVALPQSPETRRPDRHPQAARAARDRVLERMQTAGIISVETLQAALNERVPQARRSAPALAWHESEEAVRAAPKRARHHLTIDRSLQDSLEKLLRERADSFGPGLTAALIAADYRSGEIVARIGNADPLTESRKGAIDMTRALRSPGSTLKPFIYAMAFESGLVHPDTLMEDRPTRFGLWSPSNFDLKFQGTIAARQALQLSLNVPAIALLDLVGPGRLVARFDEIGVKARLPRGEAPGLAIGLGGVGLRLIDLVQLYAALARGGDSVPLRSRLDEAADMTPRRSFGAAAAWYVADSLQNTPAPEGAPTGRYAYKTGTSYGYRDAWAIGFDGQRVIGVWVGRADGTAVPGLTGRAFAAPILFDALQRMGAYRPLPPPPTDALIGSPSSLPQALRRFGGPMGEARRADDAPRIAFPADGMHLDLGFARHDPEAIVVKLAGGTPPYHLLVDGRPATLAAGARVVELPLTSAGRLSIAVIDSSGRSHSVAVTVE